MAHRTESPSAPRLLIDGYNVMFGSIGGPDTRNGVHALKSARQRLLEYMASRMDVASRRSCWIVFDSADETGLPSETSFREMRIFFAKDDASADEFLIRTIRRHPHPKLLVVVTSDHQIQRVATARRATPYDSEVWVSDILPLEPIGANEEANRLESQGNTEALERQDEKPDVPMDSNERKQWLRDFGFE